MTDQMPAEGDNRPIKQDKWARQIEFTLSCVGYSIGLGNLWRFPYLCMRNGGGAFLIPYFTMMVTCGFPLFVLELVLGQFSSRGAIEVWRICPLLKGVGWCTVVLTFIYVVYFNVMMAWIIYFLFVSFGKDVPWKTCDNSWNTDMCRELGVANRTMNATYNGSFVKESILDGKYHTPADEFWHRKVLDMSDGIEHIGIIKWEIALCLAAVVIMLMLCIFKGIKTSGKVVYVTATVPYLFLTILLIRGATLPGSLIGIKYFIIPDWAMLKNVKVWAEAGLQVFFSLGPAWGGLITMASHNKFNNNLIIDAAVTCASCGLTSLYAGFVIFSVIGFMAHTSGLPVDQVIAQGPGLAFVAYPQAVAELPFSPLWAVFFFLMLLTLGVDTQFVSLEVVVNSVIDAFPRLLQNRRQLFTAAMSLLFFLLGLPFCTQGGMYLFQIIDWYMALVALFILSLLECIVVVYVYGIGRMYYEMSMMFGGRITYFWAVMWGGVTPAIILAISIFSVMQLSPPYYGDYQYPDWAIGIGFAFSFVALIPIPVFVVYKIASVRGTYLTRVTTLLHPEPDWGPISPADRKGYKYDNRRYTWIERFMINQNQGTLFVTEWNQGTLFVTEYSGLSHVDQAISTKNTSV